MGKPLLEAGEHAEPWQEPAAAQRFPVSGLCRLTADRLPLGRMQGKDRCGGEPIRGVLGIMH